MNTDQDGVAVLELEPDRAYTVTVSRPGYRSASADTPVLQDGQELEVSFRLQQRSARVRVVVTDARTGSPLSGAEVTATPKA